MRRYVTVRHSTGKTTATVALVDGDLAARWTVTTYIGEVGKAVTEANARASRALHEARQAAEELE